MLDTGGKPPSSRSVTTQQVCTLVIEGRQLGVDLDLVREIIPNAVTHEIDVVLRIDDEVILLGVEEVGPPMAFDEVVAAGVEMLTPAQLLRR